MKKTMKQNEITKLNIKSSVKRTVIDVIKQNVRERQELKSGVDRIVEMLPINKSMNFKLINNFC
jgi:hypothetical protein